MKRMLTLAVLCAALGVFGAPAHARTVVLFDEGHGQRFLIGGKGELDLSSFAAIFREAGCEVRSNSGPIDQAALNGVSALIISGAFTPLTSAEIEAIGKFLLKGGRLAVMLHIGQPVQGLLEKMGLQYSRGTVHESEGTINGRSGDFTVVRFEPHALTNGLARLSTFGCWALKSNGKSSARVIARTGPQSWLDSDNNGVRSSGDLVGTQALAVAGELGAGAYVVFGDDAIFQNRFLKAYNTEIAKRLARWLAPAAAPKAPRRPRKPGTTDL